MGEQVEQHFRFQSANGLQLRGKSSLKNDGIEGWCCAVRLG
jgi:hypothetical protein